MTFLSGAALMIAVFGAVCFALVNDWSFLSMFALALAVFGGVCVALADDWSELGVVMRQVGWTCLVCAVLLSVVDFAAQVGVLR